jgi:hypothetical protein
VRAVPRLCELYPGTCLTTEEKAQKNLNYGIQKVPRYPNGSIQYTVTQKQYTEKHNETEYTERNIHNNKIT